MATAARHAPSPRRLARRFPVTTFVVLAFVVTWCVWMPRALVSQGYLDSQWPLTLGKFWTYGPAVAAVLAAWFTFGRAGLRELGSRLRRWRVGWRWYAVVLLGPAAFWGVVVAITAALGWSQYLGKPLLVQHGLAAAVPLLVYLALTDGLGEETGWRGYALPRQLERFDALSASLLLGFVQALWHLPLFWTEGTSLYGSSPWILLLERPAASILFTWVFLHTRGSALLAILFHASWNLCTTSAGIAGEDHWGPTLVFLALSWLWAGIVVASWLRRPATGSVRPPAAVMRSVSPARRASAFTAIVAVVAGVVLVLITFIRHPLALLVAWGCLGVVVAGAAYAVTRTGLRRRLAVVVAVLALAAPLVMLVVDRRLVEVLVLIAVVAIAGVATKYALGRDIKSLKSSPTPGTPVGRATRPVLLMNPKSGGGKVERFQLAEEASRRGITPVVLGPDDDLLALAEQAVADGADVLGMAGGDGSQALVATVAARHDVGFVCVPAGTRNHLAMDLGLDRGDVVGALDAFGQAVERRIDLGLVGERVFVNNATVGLYAKIVQSPAYRDRKVGTALELLPDLLGPHAAPFDLRFTGPDGTEHASAHLILVSNDRYELGSGEGFGSRRRIDSGNLGIVAARFGSPKDAASFARRQANGGRRRRPEGWLEWSDTTFEIRSDQPVEVGLDGEALVLDPPIRFRIMPGALRVRLPTDAPGYSPAAAVPTKGWATITALLQTAAGRPVAIEP